MSRPGAHDLTALKRVLLASNREILARGLVILAATVGVLVVADQLFVALWTLSYVAATLVYYWVLKRLPDSVTIRGLVLVAGFEALVTLHWPILFVYLWSLGETVFLCIAMLIIAAAMTNAMGSRSEVSLLRISDLSSSTVLVGLMVTLLWLGGHDLLLTIIAAVVSVLILVWLFVSLRESGRTRMRLAQAERSALERQRIEAIGRLTGGVAHDFNNILTVIGGNLDLAIEVPDGPEREALLAEARRATDRAASVTAQLLAYSRQSVLAPDDVEVCAAMNRVEAFLSRLLPETITLVFVNELQIQRLRLDQSRLESALINLILNARDAISGPGRIMVTARPWPRPPPGTPPLSDHPLTGPNAQDPYVCIEVRDTGAGIPAAILPNVVEPYFTTKPVGRGSGLGLSMAKGFAEQSGGALTIESKLGVGTTVRMFFPSRLPAPEPDPATPPETGPKRGPMLAASHP